LSDRVLIHNDHREHKLDIEWLGSYTIEKVKIPYYEILIDGNIKKINSAVTGPPLCPEELEKRFFL
jgi:hypothetical protein